MKNNSIRNCLSAALLLAVVAAAAACGPSTPPPKPSPDTLPELTDEKIHEALLDAAVYDVPEERGAAEPISWNFMRDEPTDLAIVERQMDGKQATVIVDITTRSSPRSRRPKVLSGRLRLHFELQVEIFLRKWKIVDVENISMKYRDEPRPDTAPKDGEGPPEPPAPPPSKP